MRRKVNGRMVDISREAMRDEILKLQEFSPSEYRTLGDWKDVVNWIKFRASAEELGGVLGYWDVGDGTYDELGL